MPTRRRRTDRLGVASGRLTAEGLAAAMETVLQKTQVATLSPNHRLPWTLPVTTGLDRRYR